MFQPDNDSPVKRLLYIEDDKNEAEIVRRLYEMVQMKFHGGVEFIVRESLHDGIDAVEMVMPDVVLLDLALPPNSDTENTLSELASHAKTWPPTIILTNNKYDLTLRRRCFLIGAEDFMFKDQAHRDPELLCERIYHAHLRRIARDGQRA